MQSDEARSESVVTPAYIHRREVDIAWWFLSNPNYAIYLVRLSTWHHTAGSKAESRPETAKPLQNGPNEVNELPFVLIT